jgi:hypothetical protein
MWSALVAVTAATACSVPPVDYTGKACPCPSGWSCGAANTCTLGAGDAPSGDGRNAMHDAGAEHDGSELTYRAAVIADHPLAYWRLDDTGTTAVDQMGNYTGTYSGDCTHGVAGALVGDPDTAIALGGTCEVTFADTLVFLDNAPYSVEAWIKDTATPAGHNVVFSEESRSTTGPLDGYDLVDSTTGVYISRATSTSGEIETQPTTHVLDSYIHLVGVYDGSDLVLYVDGSASAPVDDPVVMPSYTAAALIGADVEGSFFTGDIDEVAIYGQALTAAQVTEHYELGVGGPRD